MSARFVFLASLSTTLGLGCLPNPTVYACDLNTGDDCSESMPDDDGGSISDPENDDGGASDSGSAYHPGSVYTFHSMQLAKRLVIGNFSGAATADLAFAMNDGGLELWRTDNTTSIHRIARLGGLPAISGLGLLTRVNGGGRADLVIYYAHSTGHYPELRRGDADPDGGPALELLSTIATNSVPTSERMTELNGAPPTELVTLEGDQVVVYANAGPGYAPVASYPTDATRLFTYSAYAQHYIVTSSTTHSTVTHVSPTIDFSDAGSTATPALFTEGVSLFSGDSWLIGPQVSDGSVTSYRLGEDLAQWSVTDALGAPLNWANSTGITSSPFAWHAGSVNTTVVGLPDAGVFVFTPVSASGMTLAGSYDRMATGTPVSLATGDINGDGKVDVAFVNAEGAGLVMIMGR